MQKSQRLVTWGIYRYLRHPIFTAQWLWCIGQVLLLHNWIAGWTGTVTFLPFYFYYRPRLEQMMLKRFGAAYLDYMQHTGGIIPRFRK